MPSNDERTVEKLRERLSRVVGDIAPEDLNIVALCVTGDPVESVYVLPSGRGRYPFFTARQRGQIADLMGAWGFTPDGERRWTRTLTEAEMFARDEGYTVTPEAGEEGPPPGYAPPSEAGGGEVSGQLITGAASTVQAPQVS